ncbi:Trp biosynthesis-associated membrane protein [Microbacterium sp. No. 7]|uniref:Trp biosynthesis-associated membrane protein n=1 Tax=Microbacterium sp. No. 7 TaxID=1714373 RepID=UPI0006D1E965|nr:Trp biosynthesis-associated membrane protein [Microbacterium sp. No. 7]ALJ20197.1 peptidase [Microbacterium sp. No. 7]
MRRARLVALLVIVVGGALALISSTQSWLLVTLGDTGDVLEVSGDAAVPLLAPLSLAALALGLALALVGRPLRYAFGALALAIGATLAWSAWRIAAEHPLDAVAAVVTEATGLAGTAAVSALVSSISATAWPVLALAAAVLIGAGGVFTLATAHRWAGSGRRYRTDAAEADRVDRSRPHDAIDSWDDLSRGDDPTDR